MKTNLLLIDDQHLFRQGVKHILERHPSFRIVGDCDNGKKGILFADRLKPDVILLDINISDMNGFEAVKRILANNPEQRILILSGNENEEHIQESIKAGAHGYLLKESNADTLIEAIQYIADGGSYLDPKVAPAIISHYRELKGETSQEEKRTIVKPYHLLTAREIEVLQYLAYGYSNRDMAEKLYISDKTVKNHVSSILLKMKVRDRTQAVLEAYKKDWVTLS